jgi:hypothetical protein
MGDAGYRNAEADFGFAAQTVAYERLYAEVLEKRRAGR